MPSQTQNLLQTGGENYKINKFFVLPEERLNRIKFSPSFFCTFLIKFEDFLATVHYEYWTTLPQLPVLARELLTIKNKALIFNP